MKTVNNFGLVLIAVAALSGCKTAMDASENVPAVLESGPYTPFVDLIARKSELTKSKNKEAGEVCKDAAWPAYYQRRRPEKVVLMSGPIDRARVNIQEYYNAINSAFPSYLAGRKDVLLRLKNDLVVAANMSAFEEIKPNNFGLQGHHPNNEPIFHQAMLLLSLGIAYSALEQVYGADDPDIIAIKAWGNRIFIASNSGRDNFIGRTGGIDRAAGKAAAYSVWGISANNPKALAAGFGLFQYAISSIGSDGKFSVFGYKGYVKNLYHGNMTYGWATIAAEALTKAGLRAFDMGKPGQTMHNGVDWLVQNIFEHHLAIRSQGQHSGTRTLAWMEYYIARFPNREISEFTSAKIERLKLDGGFNGGMFGGWTTCMVKNYG